MSIERLKNLQALNDEKGLEMMMEKGRFAALKSRHEEQLQGLFLPLPDAGTYSRQNGQP